MPNTQWFHPTNQFYGWEFWFVGWNHWVFGIYWGHEPEIHLGPWMLRLDED